MHSQIKNMPCFFQVDLIVFWYNLFYKVIPVNILSFFFVFVFPFLFSLLSLSLFLFPPLSPPSHTHTPALQQGQWKLNVRCTNRVLWWTNIRPSSYIFLYTDHRILIKNTIFWFVSSAFQGRADCRDWLLSGIIIELIASSFSGLSGNAISGWWPALRTNVFLVCMWYFSVVCYGFQTLNGQLKLDPVPDCLKLSPEIYNLYILKM